MKKHILLIATFLAALTASAQSRGIRIGYIDMDYILSKVPDYAQANSQLEQKAMQWKKEMEVKRNDITKLKDNLKSERVLLTKELIEEREEEITFQENELLAYQEKRFGPKGDLITQKAVLVKPIQDQVFTAVQEIAEKKYDFVFDKSSDLTMLFSNQRYDISDQVVRRITRASNREQRSNKELKQLEKKEAEEDLMDDPDYAERQKSKEEKKNARQEALDKRNADRAAKREEAIQRREQLKQERLAKRNGAATGTQTGTNAAGSTTQSNTNAPSQGNLNDEDVDDAPATTNSVAPNNGNRTSPNNTSLPVNNTTDRRTQGEPIQGQNTLPVKTTATDTPEEGTQESVNRQQAAQDAQDARAKKLEERKRAQEERKQKILAEREAARKAREEQKNNKTNSDDKNTDDKETENKN